MSVAEYCRRRPYTAQRTLSAREAAAKMKEAGVGSLVVIDGKLPVGIITDRDIALKVLCGKLDPDAVEVGSLREGPLVCVREQASLAEAVDRLRVHLVRRLPVVDANGHLVGIITSDDLLALIAEEIEGVAQAAMAHPPKAPVPLEEIRRESEISRSE